MLGLQQNGVGVTTSQFYEEGATGGTLKLDLQVGMGQVEVRRVSADGGSAPTTSASSTTSILG